MMMEEEIERTKEEIKGIEEACEKVEQVLDKVIQSRGLNGHVELLEDVGEEEEGKMEDVIQDVKAKEGHNYAGHEGLRSNWFEDGNLLSLWNGNGPS
jgi:hypothetical protein